MKKLKNTYIRTFVVVFALIVSGLCHAMEETTTAGDDSVNVSLLTCSPGNEVYSLYGHTALRYHDLRTGEDWTFNYGVFNFRKPFFSLRFMVGLTDYELGVLPFQLFRQEYMRHGRSVSEQVLNLTPQEKHRLKAALAENYRPENREYRYNFFRDNCTTRARDMVERSIVGEQLFYPAQQPLNAGVGELPTLREMIHKYCEGHPWARFSNDLCLGLTADITMTWREQQFLPELLMADFSESYIVDNSGGTRPLVRATRTVVDPGVRFVEEEFPLTPTECFALLLAVTVGIAIIEYKRKRTFVVWDVVLMALTGLSGILLTVFFCSQHPTTSTNLLILLINPLPLFFIYKVARRRPTMYWKLSVLMIILFFLGFFVQVYAEGMLLLALSLLVRSIVNIKLNKA